MQPDHNQGEQQPDYSFIMSSPERPKRALLNTTTKMGRIGVTAGFGGLILVLLIVFGGLIRSATSQGTKDMADLVAYQAELARVLSLGNEKTRSAELRTKAVTSSYTLKSQYQVTTKLVKKRGVTVKKTDLVKYKGTANDTALSDAEKANRFDEVYAAIYTEKLTAYQAKLAATYLKVNKNEQLTLKAMNEAVKTLLL